MLAATSAFGRMAGSVTSWSSGGLLSRDDAPGGRSRRSSRSQRRSDGVLVRSAVPVGGREVGVSGPDLEADAIFQAGEGLAVHARVAVDVHLTGQGLLSAGKDEIDEGPDGAEVSRVDHGDARGIGEGGCLR